jgi:hypothetical protein
MDEEADEVKEKEGRNEFPGAAGWEQGKALDRIGTLDETKVAAPGTGLSLPTSYGSSMKHF